MGLCKMSNKETTIVLPKLGESIVSATIVRWFKNVGDTVKLDESLLEVATDKVSSEIPSPIAGTIKKLLARPDEEVAVGAPLAIISAHVEHKAATPQSHQTPTQTQETFSTEKSSFFSPALLRLAQEFNISMQELEKVPRTGEGGRLTKKDLEAYIHAKKTPQKPQESGSIERIKMSPIRKAIAENMTRSFYTAPHATLITEIDVTSLLKTIEEHREAFLARHGAKLTITTIVAKTLAESIQSYPLLNCFLEEDSFILRDFVNLGIAVSVDQGVLVPVIKNCHLLSLGEIAHTIQHLSAKARAGSLGTQEFSGGTITLSNFGMSGIQIGIPIIRYPEVAILAIGSIDKKVVPLDGDTLAVRSFIHLSLTFDHRVFDGMYGCAFLNNLKRRLEHPEELHPSLHSN